METQSRGVPGSYLPATAVPALAPPCRGLQAHSVAFGYTAPTAPIACDCDALHKVMPCCIKLSQGGWSHAATAATAEHTRCGWTLEVVSWHGCASLDILGLAAVGWMPNVRINSYACIPSHCIQTNAHSCVATRNAVRAEWSASKVCECCVEPCGQLERMNLPTLHCNAERFHHLHPKHNRRGSKRCRTERRCADCCAKQMSCCIPTVLGVQLPACATLHCNQYARQYADSPMRRCNGSFLSQLRQPTDFGAY